MAQSFLFARHRIRILDAPTTVLVAEDSATQALRFRFALENAGFRTIMSANGREALESVRQARPDAIVTDLNMPEMGGLELVAAVHSEFPAIPIVLATATGSEAAAAEALHRGATSFVPKAFVRELIPTLRRVLAIARTPCDHASLDSCATYVELRFRLTNEETLAASLSAQLKQSIQRLEIRVGGDALRAAVALEEALGHAIIHGNLEVSSRIVEAADLQAANDLASQRRQTTPFQDRRVHVQAKLTRESAEFTIRDEGPGIDPRALADPTAPEQLNELGRRSLWLMHAFMDEVRFNDRGNEVTMILRKR